MHQPALAVITSPSLFMPATRTTKIPVRNKLEAAGFLLVFLAALIGGWLWAEWS